MAGFCPAPSTIDPPHTLSSGTHPASDLSIANGDRGVRGEWPGLGMLESGANNNCRGGVTGGLDKGKVSGDSDEVGDPSCSLAETRTSSFCAPEFVLGSNAEQVEIREIRSGALPV